MGTLLLLVTCILHLLPVSLQFKDIYHGCTVLYEGCDIEGGRCVCGRTIDSCYNTFLFNNIQHCKSELFKPTTNQERGVPAVYPSCVAAQYNPICNPAHISTKYCHGSCDTTCCLIAEDGCLPPTNVYVPASACGAAERDVCQGHRCSKGYKCESVKLENCPVLPCKKRPSCVVDDEFNPCPLVTCPQGRHPKICVRRRSNCRRDKCPYTFSCELVSSFVKISGRRAGCPHCPRLAIQESYCKNNFAARVKVKELIWSKRFYKSLGICDWYSSTVEYIVRGNPPQTALGNATLLVRRDRSCSCLPSLSLGERYLMIGMVLGHAYDDMPQILHIPTHGFIKPWQVVRKRHQLLNFGECPDSPGFYS